MSGRGELGRLVPETNLRSVWPDEARDFTPWMSRPENLDVLEQTLGLSLQVEGTEHGVGPYRADIVCRDHEGRRVLIENQLESTDHLHLGQLLTYAGGVDGRVMVWIAKRFTDEHRAAIDWLNTNTRDGVEFFAVEVQLWRIGASELAPRFNVVCRPNAWSRTVEKQAVTDERRERNIKFWTGFIDFVGERSTLFNDRNPSSNYWLDISLGIGRSDMLISIWNRWGLESKFSLYLKGEHKSYHFRKLRDKHRTLVEGVLAPFGQVEWREVPGQKSATILVTRKMPPDDAAQWPGTYSWFWNATDAVLRDLAPTLRDLRYEPEDRDAGDLPPVDAVEDYG
jgi:hypothetical protein